MTEKRFNAKGVVGILVWIPDWDDPDKPSVPHIRIYNPKDPETGWARRKPNGDFADFTDYNIRDMVDPSIKIVDDGYEFVETEDGDCYLDFSLRVLGYESGRSDK